MRNLFTRSNTSPNLKTISATTPLKSSISTPQPVLPNFPLIRRVKKRVRFELKLESVEEEKSPSIPNHDNPVVPTIKPDIRIIGPRQEDRSLKILEKQDTVTPSIPIVKRRSRRLVSHEFESYSHTFGMENKLPELAIDLFADTTPPLYLPSLIHRATSTKKTNHSERKQSSTFVDSALKQRLHLATPPHSIRSRKVINSASKRNHLYSAVKPIDLSLPIMKYSKYNEKLIRTDNPFATKTITEFFQTKKTY